MHNCNIITLKKTFQFKSSQYKIKQEHFHIQSSEKQFSKFNAKNHIVQACSLVNEFKQKIKIEYHI